MSLGAWPSLQYNCIIYYTLRQQFLSSCLLLTFFHQPASYQSFCIYSYTFILLFKWKPEIC